MPGLYVFRSKYAKLNEINSDIAGLQTDIDAIQVNVNNLQTDIDILKVDTSLLKSGNTTIEGNTDNIQSDVTVIKDGLEAIEQQIEYPACFGGQRNPQTATEWFENSSLIPFQAASGNGFMELKYKYLDLPIEYFQHQMQSVPLV